jgi:hypothetical protein
MKKLEEELLSIEDSIILHVRSRGPYPRVVDSADLKENDQQWLFFCLVRTVDLSQLPRKSILKDIGPLIH